MASFVPVGVCGLSPSAGSAHRTRRQPRTTHTSVVLRGLTSLVEMRLVNSYAVTWVQAARILYDSVYETVTEVHDDLWRSVWSYDNLFEGVPPGSSHSGSSGGSDMESGEGSVLLRSGGLRIHVWLSRWACALVRAVLPRIQCSDGYSPHGAVDCVFFFLEVSRLRSVTRHHLKELGPLAPEYEELFGSFCLWRGIQRETRAREDCFKCFCILSSASAKSNKNFTLTSKKRLSVVCCPDMPDQSSVQPLIILAAPISLLLLLFLIISFFKNFDQL